MATRNIHGLIRCGSVNIQSVGNKTLEIHELINEERYDILAIAGTWLGEVDTAKINEMTPVTHIFVSAPRTDRRGGGVRIFYIKLVHEN